MFGTKKKARTVEMLHSEIDTASAKLVVSAQGVLTLRNVSVDYSSMYGRLMRLGFNNSALVTNAEKQMGAQNMDSSQAKLITDYANIYPDVKFLTLEVFHKICDDWGLIYAPVYYYTGSVPEKNIAEMENVKPLSYEHHPEKSIFVEITEFSNYCPKSLRKLLKGLIELDCPMSKFSESWERTDALYQYAQEKGYMGEKPSGIHDKLDIHERETKGLFIASDAKDINPLGLDKKSRYGYMKVQTSKVNDDPIVFRFCKGGVQVITKWGPEAADPRLVNEKMN